MVTMPAGYFDRFDPSKEYERSLFIAGNVVQSAELNEVQETALYRVKTIADVLFKDGAIVSGCGINVDLDTGITALDAGTVYVYGGVRSLAAASVTIPISGTVSVGAYLIQSVITNLQDPSLVDPAVGLRNTGMVGAARLQMTVQWGLAGDGTAGDFYPVYTVVNGVPLSQTPPPEIDAVSTAIASYDVESSGGFYIVSGLTLTQMPDLATGQQSYSLAEGVARVNGTEITLPHSLRLTYAAIPNLATVLAEPSVAAGGTETITPNHSPIAEIDQVLINAQSTATMTHGAYSGAADALPNSPVLSIVAVNQGGTWNATSGTFSGGTTYVQGTDYKLTSDAVDWSLSGAEPSPGSTYQAVYRFISSVTPSNVTATTFQVTGAVPGSVTQTSYKWKLPRIDCLCLDDTGLPTWVQGVPNATAPNVPPIPAGVLELAQVLQTWASSRTVTNDGIRTISMSALTDMANQINNLYALVSQLSLQVAVAASDPTNKYGVFTDPLTDDSERDQGSAQTASVYQGIMTLPITGVTVSEVSLSGSGTLPFGAANPVIQQTLRTKCMLVNPYQAFNPIPASASLQPATDFWTATQDVWTSPVTEEFETTANLQWGWAPGQILRSTGTADQIVVDQNTSIISSSTEAAEYLRQIVVGFSLSGFAPGEKLNTVTFDSTPVAFGA